MDNSIHQHHKGEFFKYSYLARLETAFDVLLYLSVFIV